MMLSDVVGSRYITNGNLPDVVAALEHGEVVDIAGCILSMDPAIKLSSAPNVIDSSNPDNQRILDANRQRVKITEALPPRAGPLSAWVRELSTEKVYRPGASFVEGVLALATRPQLQVDFHAYGRDMITFVSLAIYGDRYKHSQAPFLRYSSLTAEWLTYTPVSERVIRLATGEEIELRAGCDLIPGDLGMRVLLRDPVWEPVLESAMHRLSGVATPNVTLYSFLKEARNGL